MTHSAGEQMQQSLPERTKHTPLHSHISYYKVKKYSEEECVKSLAKVCRINEQAKTVRATKGNLGLHRLGKLDYLVHYKGWSVIWE